MKKTKLLKILANREEYLKTRQEELNRKQSQETTYNYQINLISGQLCEISFIAQMILCLEEEEK